MNYQNVIICPVCKQVVPLQHKKGKHASITIVGEHRNIRNFDQCKASGLTIKSAVEIAVEKPTTMKES